MQKIIVSTSTLHHHFILSHSYFHHSIHLPMTYAQPRPIDDSLLRLQDNHISNQVWEGQERIVRLRYTSVWAFTHLDQIDNRVKNLITLAGFGHVINVEKVDINQHLVSTLVEHWRTETHTFHFPHGEATITLQDVALQLGLKIDGLPVTGFITGDVSVACQTLLGKTPPDKYVKGKMIYLTWLRQNFQQLLVDDDDVVIAQHARAHIIICLIISYHCIATGRETFIVANMMQHSGS